MLRLGPLVNGGRADASVSLPPPHPTLQPPARTSGHLWPGAGAFGSEGLSAKLTGGGESQMDQRIEPSLGDVLALAGEEPDAVPEGVRRALAKCEAIFRLQEPKKRMRDQAAHVCRALCCSRVVAEMHQRRGTRIAEHLKLVLSIIDRQGP